MRAANSANRRPGEIVRVRVGGEDHAPSVLVDAVILVHEAENRQGEKRRDVSVVHDKTGAVAVDFEGEDVAVVRVVDDGVFPDSVFKGGAAMVEFLGEVVLAGLAEDLCCFLELD